VAPTSTYVALSGLLVPTANPLCDDRLDHISERPSTASPTDNDETTTATSHAIPTTYLPSSAVGTSRPASANLGRRRGPTATSPAVPTTHLPPQTCEDLQAQISANMKGDRMSCETPPPHHFRSNHRPTVKN
jgi:hypothetical protein